MTERDTREALDLLMGALLLIRAECAGLTRGRLYRDSWIKRASELLSNHGRVLPTTSGMDTSTPAMAVTHTRPRLSLVAAGDPASRGKEE